MRRRVTRRALVAILAALTTLSLATAVAYADTVPADGDVIAAGNQSLVDLGEAAPGATLTRSVAFTLTCAGLGHPAAGATITLALDSASVPLDGAASATTTTIGPVPADWTPSGEGCPSPAPTLAAAAPSTVTLTMPTTPGTDYDFTLAWSRTGATGLTGMSTVTFRVDVVANTPPTLNLPAAKTAEATSPSGAEVTWTASATDTEDATAPTPTCTPSSGSTFALGTTTVDCSVTDTGGLSDRGSFVVTVEDTTAPTLRGVPADRALTTGDPTGTTLAYTSPTASDVVDPDPRVACAPASGSWIPVGTTTVRCTATDAAGNRATRSFDVVVTFVEPVAWSVDWGEPIARPGSRAVASSGASFIGQAGRTIPVKLGILADGVAQTTGAALLEVRSCAGTGPTVDVVLEWDGRRWAALFDTSLLAGPGCYVVGARFDGRLVGSFDLQLKAAPATTASPAP